MFVLFFKMSMSKSNTIVCVCVQYKWQINDKRVKERNTRQENTKRIKIIKEVDFVLNNKLVQSL